MDDASHIDHKWFEGVETLLLTAGASAPEDLVQEIIEMLKVRYDATIEPRLVTEEDMHFELPMSLRKLERSHALPIAT